MNDEDAARIWHAVLWQAVRDAVNYGNGPVPNDYGARGSLDWFDSADSKTICGRTGMDWKSIRDGVHRLREKFKQDGKQAR